MITSISECKNLKTFHFANNKMKFIQRMDRFNSIDYYGNPLIRPFGAEYSFFHDYYDYYVKIVKCIITIQRKFKG